MNPPGQTMNGLPGEEIFMILHRDYSNFKKRQQIVIRLTEYFLFPYLIKNRIISKVIQGYEEKTTDKEIKDAINTLL